MPEEQEQIEKSPIDILRESIKGFPTQERIESWKSQVPAHRVKLFCPDGARVYFLRGMSGIEFSGLQKQMVQNAENPEQEMAILASSKCTLWTNTTPTGALDEAVLRTGTAGIPQSLFEIVQNLSDFYSPAQIYQFSLEM